MAIHLDEGKSNLFVEGYMIVWLTEKTYQRKIANSIYKLLTREYPQRQYVSLAVRKEKIHASRLSDVLADLLEIVEDDVYHKILKILHLLVDGPKETCRQKSPDLS